jgi:hypothetical protein
MFTPAFASTPQAQELARAAAKKKAGQFQHHDEATQSSLTALQENMRLLGMATGEDTPVSPHFIGDAREEKNAKVRGNQLSQPPTGAAAAAVTAGRTPPCSGPDPRTARALPNKPLAGNADKGEKVRQSLQVNVASPSHARESPFSVTPVFDGAAAAKVTVKSPKSVDRQLETELTYFWRQVRAREMRSFRTVNANKPHTIIS